MGRIAGDAPGYYFRMVRMIADVVPQLTPHGFTLPSVSTILGETVAKPPSAMAWWGYRILRDGVLVALDEDAEAFLDSTDDSNDPEKFEEYMKGRGYTPNISLDEAGDRGSKAHTVAECLAEGWQEKAEDPTNFRAWAEALAMDEEFTSGTRYGWAAIAFWDEEIQPKIDRGEIVDVRSEVPVYSLEDRFAGTFDLALLWSDCTDECRDLGPHMNGGWEVIDYKTHKPADGYTKPGRGPGYDSEAAQNRAYRKAIEEMGRLKDIFRSWVPRGAKTIGQRTVILRDREYRGSKVYLVDYREVPYAFFKHARELYDMRLEFKRGDAE